MPKRIPNALSIAGVDPSGGAGVLADVKTFSALGAYGCAVIAALTAQNTGAVTGVWPVAPDFVARQIDTLLSAQLIPRVNDSEDIADALLFLCSAEAKMITGLTLPVDGGMHAK